MEFRIRDAAVHDVPTMTAIQNALLATDTIEWTERLWAVPERVAWFRDRRAAGRPVLVAVDSTDTAIGWASFGDFRDVTARPGYRGTAELTVHVTRDHWRHGVGAALLDALIASARDAGLHVLVAGIDADNAASISLHRRRGFVEVAHMPEVGTKFGRWLDLVLMQLRLDGGHAPAGHEIHERPPGPTLAGRRVRLEPLSFDHAPALVAAANEDRSAYRFAAVPDGLESMHSAIGDLLAAQSRGEVVPFAQVRIADGVPVGMTRFLAIRRDDPRAKPIAVEIGGTWLGASAQRSGINREAKRLLLAYAFEHWRVRRVDVKTDARNEHARRAIEGIGATLEGVLRAWQPSQVPGEDGRSRDTAMYSIVADEWPAVRAALDAGLGAIAPDPLSPEQCSSNE